MTIQRQHFHILWTAIMALVLTLTVLPASPAKAQPTPAMKELQRYVQKTVPLKWEQQMDLSRKVMPALYAIAMGWGMQKQMQYAGQDSVKNAQVETLKQEIIADLKSLARECNYINTQNGEPMTSEGLVSVFLDSMNGKLNDLARKSMNGFNPNAIEVPYIADGRTIEPLYKLQPRKKGAVLLGEKAGPAEVVDPKIVKATKVQSQNLMGLICPMQMPPRSNKQLTWYGQNSLKIPYNGVLNDKKYISCEYQNNGRLWRQSGHAPGEVVTVFNFSNQGSVYHLGSRYEELDDGNWRTSTVMHGAYEQYWVSKNGKPYLMELKQYRNGKIHGKEQRFSEHPSGKIYLSIDNQYVNGLKHGTSAYYNFDEKTGKVYLVNEQVYRENRREKVIMYNPDGSVKQ